jgi:hypothetical protein
MEKDSDIVAIWLKKDPKRWFAGALAGAFAGLMALIFASVLASLAGYEIWFAAKILALPFLGGAATELGLSGAGFKAFLIGFIAFELLTAFWGMIYAHFTGTNSLGALLGMGLTWGAFSWIFLNNLFSPSFLDIRALKIPNSAAFFVWMVYGVALTSVAYFDKAVRANK